MCSLKFRQWLLTLRHTTIVCKRRSHKQKLSLKKATWRSCDRWSVKAIKFEQKQAVSGALSKFKCMPLGEDVSLEATKQKGNMYKSEEMSCFKIDV